MKIKLTRSSLIIVHCLLLTIITFIAFSNIFKNDFVNWDDDLYLGNNFIKNFSFSISHIKDIFSSNILGNYHPLTVLVLGIENYFFNNNPLYFHIVALSLHLINVILVYIFINFLIQNLPIIKSNNHAISFITAIIFGIHPMHVESVAWISDLKDLLYTFFYLLSLIFYVKFLTNKSKSNLSFIHYLVSIIFYLFSLFSKSSAITLPFILILTDYFLTKSEKFLKPVRFLIDKMPFIILAIIFAFLNFKFQNDVGVVHTKNDFFPIYNMVFIFTYALVYYVIRFIFPFNLCAVHPFPIENYRVLPMEYYLSFPILIIILIIIIKLLRLIVKHRAQDTEVRAIIFGLLFFILNIVIVLQIIPFGMCIVCERYSYLPYIGFALNVGIVYVFINDYFCRRVDKLFTILRASFNILFMCLIFFVTFLTFNRNKIWANGITLFTDMINKYPLFEIAYKDRGKVEVELKQYNLALEDFNKAIELKPDVADAYSGRAAIFIYLQQYNKSIIDCNKAISLNPDFADAYLNRGCAKYFQGDEAACSDWNKSSELGSQVASQYMKKFCN